ncbi:uncharacterized protein LOC126795192 [Argentina anserina]|uniref:uncharacterized protein LOC126795192 n=1 Tax=Argentina anserina TaxID=57926 RepID=UPI0021765BE2|nr:uncharacterized protein LOC126795192 [Potentilla anserina]
MPRKTRTRKATMAPESIPEEDPAENRTKKVQNTDKTQILPESAPGSHSSVRTIQNNKLQSTEKTIVRGAVSCNYEFDYVPGSSYFNGRIVYGNGTAKDVSAVPVEQANGNIIFDACTRNNLNGEGLLLPHHYIYCREISKYVICYDRFSCSLEEWLLGWIDHVKDQNGLPHQVIRKQISKMLKSVNNIHKKRLWHSALSDISNYVVIDGDWYIINIKGTIDKENRDLCVFRDFRDFRDMLEKNVLLDKLWLERNGFFQLFDLSYRGQLVEKLLNNVFTKSPQERLLMFSTIYHGWMDRSHNHSMLSDAISNGKFNQYTDGGWNNVTMSRALLGVYNYENNQKRYDGKRIWSLIKFLRNVYEHYHDGDVQLIEGEVRQLWAGLLEKLYLYY